MDLHTVGDLRQLRDDADLRAWQESRRPGDVLLAGGSWLFSEPQLQARRLLDLTTLGWPPLTETPDHLEIAATATIAQLAAYRAGRLPVAAEVARLVGQCCEALLGSFKVWNVATVGGNLCLALPAAPMAALAAALDGSCVVWTVDGGTREIAAAGFVTGDTTTALGDGEVLRSVRLPAHALSSPVAFRRASLSPLGRSAALLIGRRVSADRMALTITAATRRPVVLDIDLHASDAVLAGQVSDAVPATLWHDDVHGLPEWREAMTHLYAQEIRDEFAARPS